MDKKRGRPAGSKKNGERTPAKQLNLLRTKAWARYCALLIGSVGQRQPAGCNKLAAAANARAGSNGVPAPGFSSAGWSRWLRGERGVSPKTIHSLWPAAQAAFFHGPPADDGYPAEYWAAAPLWAAVRGDCAEIVHDWQAVPKSACARWAPLVYAPDDEFPFPTGYCIEDSNFIPEKLSNKYEVCSFCEKILQSPHKFPPLVKFSAALTFARLATNMDKLYLFSSFLPEFGYLSPVDKMEISTELGQYGITIDEIVSACNEFNLQIVDLTMLNKGGLCKICPKLQWLGLA